MTRRPAVTLMEVLIAMFIMAIGMLALMALFPVGAVSMAQALKDDRCAYASTFCENASIATNIRYGDAYVFSALNNAATNPSGLVYVDPYGVAGMPAAPGYGLPLGAALPAGGVIQRIAPYFAYALPPPFPTPSLTSPPPGPPPLALMDRWFSLPDDLGFNLSGTPDVSNTGGWLDRGRRYSFAYLLRRQPSNVPYPLNPFPSSIYSVQLYAVVYAGRPVNPPMTLETTFNASQLGLPTLGTAGTNSLTLPAGSSIKRGGWVLDTSANPVTGQVSGYFYRVTNLADLGGYTTVELQQNLVANVTQITVMDYVAEVFDKGVGWMQ